MRQETWCSKTRNYVHKETELLQSGIEASCCFCTGQCLMLKLNEINLRCYLMHWFTSLVWRVANSLSICSNIICIKQIAFLSIYNKCTLVKRSISFFSETKKRISYDEVRRRSFASVCDGCHCFIPSKVYGPSSNEYSSISMTTSTIACWAIFQKITVTVATRVAV